MPDHSTEKHRAWLLPARKARETAAGLYIIATPIGNLGDITLRALDMLAAADVVVCEDTRVTGKLLAHYGIEDKKLLPYNDHNAPAQRAKILGLLREGKILALVSDAGMPLIADPGYKLIRECIENGIHVSSLPGANAPLTAVQLSGLPSDRFCFLGFLPPKETARRAVLEEWADIPATLVAFETPPRLLKSLRDIAQTMGAGRQVAVVREATKLFEEVRRGNAGEMIAAYETGEEPKGEIVLVIGPPEEKQASESDAREALRHALKTLSTKEAAAQVAKQAGLPRKMLYAMALEIVKNEDAG